MGRPAEQGPGANPKDLLKVQAKNLLVPNEHLRRESSLGKFFTDVHNIAAAATLRNTALWQKVGAPLTEDQARAVLEEKEFRGIGAQEYATALQISTARERTIRAIVTEVISGENNLDLSKTEKTVLAAGCDMGDDFDDFFIQWREKMAQERKEFGEDGLSAHLDANPNQFLYFVSTKVEGTDEIRDIPYAVAFPGPIDQIGRKMNKLVKDLTKLPESESSDENKQRAALIKYYTALQRGLTSQTTPTNTVDDEHERLWNDIDRKWMDIPQDRMFPINMMQINDDDYGRRVSPESGVLFQNDDDRSKRLTQMLVAQRPAVIQALTAIHSSPYLTEAHTKLEPIISVGIDAGVGLHFVPNAQSGPDRPDVKGDKGVKIRFNLGRAERGVKVHKPLIESVFGDTVPYEDQKEITDMKVVRIGANELADNAFLRSNSFERLGPNRVLLEELKADILTLAIMPALVEDPALQDKMLIGLLGPSLQYLKFAMLADPPRVNYYNAGLANLRTMMNAGVIQREGDNFTFHFENKAQLFEEANRVAKELAGVYDPDSFTDPMTAEQFMEKYCGEIRPDEPLAGIQRKLG